MRHISDEELEAISKEELFDCAQRYKKRLDNLKTSLGNRERHTLMLILSAAASQLATACAKGADERAPTDLDDGEVDRRMRDVLETYRDLVDCRGHTMWSRKNRAS